MLKSYEYIDRRLHSIKSVSNPQSRTLEPEPALLWLAESHNAGNQSYAWTFFDTAGRSPILEPGQIIKTRTNLMRRDASSERHLHSATYDPFHHFEIHRQPLPGL